MWFEVGNKITPDPADPASIQLGTARKENLFRPGKKNIFKVIFAVRFSNLLQLTLLQEYFYQIFVIFGHQINL